MNSRDLNRKLIIWIIAINAVFAAILFGIPVLLQAITPKAGLIITLITFMFSTPTFVITVVLLKKYTDIASCLVVMRVACRRASYIYGAFTGMIIGAHFWGSVGAVILGLILFFIGFFGGSRLGIFVWNRLNPPLPPDASPPLDTSPN